VVRLGLLGVAAVFCASALAIFDHGAPPLSVRPGERARTDIRSRVDFSYSDPEAFNQERNTARNNTPAVYRHEQQWAEGLLHDVTRLLDARAEAKTPESFRNLLVDQKLLADPKAAEPLWSALGAIGGDLRTEIRAPLLSRSTALDRQGIMSEDQWKDERRKSSSLPPDRPVHVEVRGERKMDEAGRRVRVDAFYSDDRVRHEGEVRQELAEYIRTRFERHGEPVVKALEQLVLGRLRPSLMPDKERTDQAVAAAVAAVGPDQAVRLRRKGDLLVRSGDEIGVREMLLLRAENVAHWEFQPVRVRLTRLGGLLLGMIVLLTVLALWIRHTEPEALMRLRQITGMAILGLGVLTVGRAAGELDWPVSVVPVPFLAMVGSLVFSVRTSAALALLVSQLCAMALGGGMSGAPLLAAGALVGSLACVSPRHRLDLLKAALAAGLAQAVAAAGWKLVEGGPEVGEVLRSAGWGLGAALAQGLVLAGALPVLEAGFGTTTSVSLLELCDQNHPLLKLMFMKAPGSHQHSMIVGMLGESAAETIGADPLLARAGGYYHDIGKIARPEYFVENAPPGQNRHDRLCLSMSAMVVIAHVKDGVELAREYRLPRLVIDVIAQHHGSTLAEYFYRRAQERGENPAEAVYRYPGPRPQTREAAIVLLADVVEAASRALEEPSVARLKSMVHDLSSRRLLEGQLDESGLTLKDLAAIEASFTRLLISMFHARIAYPGKTANGGQTNGTAKS
jgi:hypothetical protein